MSSPGPSLVKIFNKPTGDASAFTLLIEGEDALLARLALLESARESVDLQYYIYRDDKTSQLLNYYLLKCADRGIKVRIFLDDMGVDRKGAPDALVAHPNIEVKRFNPLMQYFGGLGKMINFALNPDRTTHRMHNKTFIVDGSVAIVGGRNISDKYFNASSKHIFADVEALAAGPVAKEISGSFEEFWRSEYAHSLDSLDIIPPSEADLKEMRGILTQNRKSFHADDYPEKLEVAALAERLRELGSSMVEADWRFIVDSPAKVEEKEWSKSITSRHISRFVRHAEDRVLWITPYLVPDKQIGELLTSVADNGLDIEILTNSFASNDTPLAHAAYVTRRRELIEGGVRIFEVKPTNAMTNDHGPAEHNATLHAKCLVIDRRTLVVGSMNMDPRSFYLNTELALIIHSAELADIIEQRFKKAGSPEYSYRPVVEQNEIVWRTHAKGTEVTLHDEPDTDWWQRIYLRLLSWLPVKGQL